MPILGEPSLFDALLDKLADRVKHLKFDRVLGIESRGFLIGPALALRLKLPFGPIRKQGKLPGELHSVKYELEYGHDVLEVQKSGLPSGSKCLIVDDLIATGGSLEASKRLVEMSGSEVVACLVVIELKALKGAAKLGNAPLISLFSYRS
jgi:adenine phosphoribosyltransferase